MDPRKAQEIRNQIDATVGPLNLMALRQYAALLVRCGVKQPRIFREFMLP